MTATGLTPSIVSHNVLLASLAARGAWAEALEALTHVLAAQPEGVNPNTGARCRQGGGVGAACSARHARARRSSAGCSLPPASPELPLPPLIHPLIHPPPS